MAARCKHCGISGPARTSRCFPNDDKNNQRHEFAAPPVADDGFLERKSGRLGYVCGLAIIYYGCILIGSCIKVLNSDSLQLEVSNSPSANKLPVGVHMQRVLPPSNPTTPEVLSSTHSTASFSNLSDNSFNDVSNSIGLKRRSTAAFA